MYFPIQLNNGKLLVFIVGKATEERLYGTCFRGPHVQKAGNFFRWQSPVEMFRTKGVPSQLIKLLFNESGKILEVGKFSATITLREPIGWESTDLLTNYNPEELLPFKPNRWSTALKIDPTLHELKAPKTNLATFVYSSSIFKDGHKVIIHSIYPGQDIGELNGDITKAEGRIFFDWEHPGQ